MSQIEYAAYLSLRRKVNECIWKQESSQAFTVEIKEKKYCCCYINHYSIVSQIADERQSGPTGCG